MKLLAIMLLISAISFGALAQNNTKQGNPQCNAQLPAWAACNGYDASSHAYFPDYYTFYDPKRGGYVYWEGGKWTFSASMPPFMKDADLNKTRVKILKGLSLDLYPELNYPYYMKLYPPVPGDNLVPVPIPGNPAANGQ